MIQSDSLRVSPTSPLLAESIARIRELFPDAWTEDGLDFDVLRELLGGAVGSGVERFGLNWHGKRRARQMAIRSSNTTLLPRPHDSTAWESTKNLLLEGENLEALRSLGKSYSNRIKLIYIDPPYNTGNDFVYSDNYRESESAYLAESAQVDAEGRPVSSDVETFGRLHTNWLNMMYPRLKLAHQLLRDDGVIFVSIDDTEVGHLRMLMDEIFGAENLASSIAWKKRSSPDARDTIGAIHDHLLCYVKKHDCIKAAIGKMPLSAARTEAYSNPDDDPRGDWASVDMTGMTGRATAEQYFNVTLPSGRVIGPPEGRSWGLARATYEELLADNRIWFGRTGNNVPRIKRFEAESDGQVVPSLWDMGDVGSNEEAKKETNALMGQADVFDTPKPVRLIRRMIQIATKKDTNAIVLDFFAGSGTTGEAVLDVNAEDGGNRRFILVQLDYALDPSKKQQRAAIRFCDTHKKPRVASELTKERIRRASVRVASEHPDTNIDVGFRVFRQANSSIIPWEPDRTDLENSLLTSVDHIDATRSESDLFFELLLRLGKDLATDIEEHAINEKRIFVAPNAQLLACLALSITELDVEPLARALITLRPVVRADDVTCVFRDDAFASDTAKADLLAVLEQHGMPNVRTL